MVNEASERPFKLRVGVHLAESMNQTDDQFGGEVRELRKMRLKCAANEYRAGQNNEKFVAAIAFANDGRTARVAAHRASESKAAQGLLFYRFARKFVGFRFYNRAGIEDGAGGINRCRVRR